METFGDEVAKVEWRNEDRLTDYCGGSPSSLKGKSVFCPKDTIPYVESRTSIRNFIRRSTSQPDWAKYIISQMPDKMGKEWLIPAFFNCGTRPQGDWPAKQGKPWLTQLYENNFWYLRVPKGKIGTSTMHYDQNHQIMCVFAGKKEWFMWDMQTEEENVPMWNNYYVPPQKGRPRGSDDSPIDGERVDLLRWPEFAKARWSNTTIEKGDCLFTPANLLHYVRSWSDDEVDPRNIALMTMFQPGDKYDPKACKDSPPHAPLSDYDVMWGEFPGSMDVPRCMNHIKMGYSDWKRILKQLAKNELDKEHFIDFWGQESDRSYPKKRILAAWKRFEKEGTGGSWTERVFSSTAIANLAKDVSCGQEGLTGPERKLKDDESWDARHEHALAGGMKGYTEEEHREL